MEQVFCGCGKWMKVITRRLPITKLSPLSRHIYLASFISPKADLQDNFQLRTRRAMCSVLYANHYQEGNVALVEVDLDLKERFKNIRTLFENVRLRRLGKKINVYHMASMHKNLMDVEKKKTQLEAEKKDIAKEMSHLVKMEQKESVCKRKADLIARGKEIRDDLKQVNKYFYDLEQEVIIYALQLPSDLHHSTPEHGETILREMGHVKIDRTRKSIGHMLIGKKTGTIFKKNVGPVKYFLRKDAAVIGQEITYRVGQKLRKLGFKQMSCPDVVKTIVVEGTGVDATRPEKVFILQDKEEGKQEVEGLLTNRTLHLVGASPQGFAASLTMMNIQEDYLPLRLFSVQRSYNPSRNSRDLGLFSTPQSDVVELCGVAKNAGQADLLYEEFQMIVWDLYKVFQDNIPLRMMSQGPEQLAQSEGGRVDIEAWSYSLQQFVKVGSVSTWSDFLGRRLMINWSPDANQVNPGQFVHTVHSTAINVTTLVGLLIEAYQTPNGHFEIPENLFDRWSANQST